MTCLVGTDGFDRADSDNVGDDWTELLGSSSGWKIEDSDLATDTDNDVILYRKTHPDNSADVRVEVWVKGVEGDVAKVIVSYIDDNNYLWGQVEIGALGIMTMTLWQKLNGVVTQLSVTEHAYFTTSSSWIGMIVCRQELYYPDPAWVSLTVIGGAGPVTIREDVSAPLSSYVALATGNVVGTIYFDNFNYYMLKSPVHPECPECEPPIDCLYCDTNVASYVKVTIAGVTSFLAGPTAGCIPLNGTWIIPFGDPPLSMFWPIRERCLYYKEFTVGTDVLQFHVGITDRLVANGVVDVVAYRIGWGGLKWSLDAPPVLPSCNEFSVNLPYDGYTSVNCALAIGSFPTCQVLTL